MSSKSNVGSKETTQAPNYTNQLLQQRIETTEQNMRQFEQNQQKIIQHLLKYENKTQTRIDAVNQLLLKTMTDDTKQQKQSPIIKNIEKVEQKDGININLKEILRN